MCCIAVKFEIKDDLKRKKIDSLLVNSTSRIIEFCYRAIEMAEGVRTLALLPGEQNSVPSTYVRRLITLYLQL